MKRLEHNKKYNVNRLPNERVNCHSLGYGEFSQYDPKCHLCWLGHEHTWAEHDKILDDRNPNSTPYIFPGI